MRKNLYHLRDKNFVHFRIEAINEITISRGSETAHLELQGYHWWRKKPRYRVRNALVDQHLTELTRAVIYEFVREDIDSLSLFGFGKPKREVTLYMSVDTVTVRFGSSKDNRVYVVRTGKDRVLLLDRKVEKFFDMLDGGMRAMNLTFFDVGSLHSIHYETADTAAVFEAAGGQWNLEGSPEKAIRSHVINRMLRELESIKFTDIVKEDLSPDSIEFDSVDLRITFKNSDGDIVERIAFSYAGDASELGASSSADARGHLDAGTLASLQHIFSEIGSN
jgi:hypothetical protein